jgi:hypothetical protein
MPTTRPTRGRASVQMPAGQASMGGGVAQGRETGDAHDQVHDEEPVMKIASSDPAGPAGAQAATPSQQDGGRPRAGQRGAAAPVARSVGVVAIVFIVSETVGTPGQQCAMATKRQASPFGEVLADDPSSGGQQASDRTMPPRTRPPAPARVLECVYGPAASTGPGCRPGRRRAREACACTVRSGCRRRSGAAVSTAARSQMPKRVRVTVHAASRHAQPARS